MASAIDHETQYEFLYVVLFLIFT